MTYPFIDTDVIIRLLTDHDPAEQAAAQALFERIQHGTLTVTAPATVIADAIFVLSSPRLYHLPRPVIAGALSRPVRLPHFRVRSRRAVLRALQLYASTNLDFGDIFIVAAMEQSGSATVYS
jgi:predicted nucleic acid-binding protein